MDSFFLICSYNQTAIRTFLHVAESFILVLQLRLQVDHFVF